MIPESPESPAPIKMIARLGQGAASRNYQPCRRLPPDPHRKQHVASRRELYLSPMMRLAPHGRTPGHRRIGLDQRAPMLAPCLLGCPRYGPAPPGIRSAPRIRATGQNGSSRHTIAFFDSSLRRINEQNSGLLIRGFGVQVPGGAPVMTWGFTTPGHFLCAQFVHLCAPCALGGAKRGAGRLVKYGRIGLDQPNPSPPTTSRSVNIAGRTLASIAVVSG
jgi:hypothetical protein